MFTKFFSLGLTFGLIFFSACGDHKKDDRVIDKENGITGLKKNDPTFLRLMDTAQKYLPDFIASFQKHKGDTNYYYTIKSDYEENETHEHMWSSPVSITGNTIKCVFIDSAYELHNIKTGDTITMKLTDVEDWTIYDYSNRTKMGYFSEKYLKGQE